MQRSSRNRLNERQLQHFTGDTLFDKIARAVCRAGCLPRKELYESWELARRCHRRIRGRRIIDLACGHGLIAQILLLLDRSAPAAIAIDRRLPPSATKLHEAMCSEWPQLADRLVFSEQQLADFNPAGNDLLVSAHGCGTLTDTIIDMAIDSGSATALLPCCHDIDRNGNKPLAGWLEPTLALDIERVYRLQSAGYRVITQEIPYDITPKNRVILAIPP